MLTRGPQGTELSSHGQAFRACPHSVMEQVREAGPYYSDPAFDRVILTDLRAARALLLRPDVSAAPRSARGRSRDASPGFLEATMIQQDPPAHGRLRALLGQTFSAAKLELSRAAIEADATDLLASYQAASGFDVRSCFAIPLAIRSMVRILGIEATIEPRLMVWHHALAPALDPFAAPAAIAHMLQIQAEMVTYFERRCLDARKSVAPSGDLVTQMARADPAIEAAALAANCVLLFEGGVATTADLIVNGLYLLLSHPDQLKRLRTEPERMTGAVEETLRLEPPIAQIARIATRDIMLENVMVPAGVAIAVSQFATGCDPAVHAAPRQFDISRRQHKHLAFAAGVHACPGSHLSRMTTAIAWHAILRRFPCLRLALPLPERRVSLVLNGWDRLEVAV